MWLETASHIQLDLGVEILIPLSSYYVQTQKMKTVTDVEKLQISKNKKPSDARAKEKQSFLKTSRIRQRYGHICEII